MCEACRTSLRRTPRVRDRALVRYRASARASAGVSSVELGGGGHEREAVAGSLAAPTASIDVACNSQTTDAHKTSSTFPATEAFPARGGRRDPAATFAPGSVRAPSPRAIVASERSRQRPRCPLTTIRRTPIAESAASSFVEALGSHQRFTETVGHLGSVVPDSARHEPVMHSILQSSSLDLSHDSPRRTLRRLSRVESHELVDRGCSVPRATAWAINSRTKASPPQSRRQEHLRSRPRSPPSAHVPECANTRRGQRQHRAFLPGGDDRVPRSAGEDELREPSEVMGALPGSSPRSSETSRTSARPDRARPKGRPRRVPGCVDDHGRGGGASLAGQRGVEVRIGTVRECLPERTTTRALGIIPSTQSMSSVVPSTFVRRRLGTITSARVCLVPVSHRVLLHLFSAMGSCPRAARSLRREHSRARRPVGLQRCDEVEIRAPSSPGDEGDMETLPARVSRTLEARTVPPKAAPRARATRSSAGFGQTTSTVGAIGRAPIPRSTRNLT